MAFTSEPNDVRCMSFHGANIGEAFRNAGVWCAENNVDEMIVYGINVDEVAHDPGIKNGTYIDLFYLTDEMGAEQRRRERPSC